jgi:predicted dehydrogenase
MLHVPVLAAPDVEVPAWWADSRSGGGWLGAHGSQVIDQVRVTAGELAAVSASLPRLNESALGAEDSFIVHLRMRSGAAGVLQSSAADRGPMLIETRVAGSTPPQSCSLLRATQTGRRSSPLPCLRTIRRC